MLLLRQIGALGVVILRHWRRGPLARRRASTESQRVSALLLRLVYVGVWANMGYRWGAVLQSTAPPSLPAVGWLTLGLFLLAFVGGAMGGSSPSVRGVVHPLRAPLLDALPIHQSARVAIFVAQCVPSHALTAAAVYGVVPQAGLAHALGVGVALSVAATTTSIAVTQALRTFLSPLQVVRVGTIGLPILGFASLLLAGGAAGLPRRFQLLRPVATLVVGAGSPASGMVIVCAVFLLACAGVAAAEHIGYDHLDALPTQRIAATSSDAVTLARVEELLARREPGGNVRWLMPLYGVAFTAGAIYLGFRFQGKLAFKSEATYGLTLEQLMVRGLVGFMGGLSYMVLSGRAARTAERDVMARPLLAPLPIAPSDLLAGKERALRRQALLGCLPLFFAAAIPGATLDVAWRVTTLLAGLWFSAGAAAAVSFLTAGLGNRRSAGSGFGLAGILILLPLLRIAMAPYWWTAVVALACLVLLSVEARRAALGCVRWLDDAADTEEAAPLWRALLVFAGFLAAQSLAAQLLSLSRLSPTTSMALAYLLSAGVLVAMTVYERRAAPRLGTRSKAGAHTALGLLGGLVSGSLAISYAKLLAWLGVDAPGMPTEGSKLLLGVAVVLAAPVAEEIFFRGWLQETIRTQYAARGPTFAIVLTAFAFAAIHPPLAFAPVLVLGLVTGVLFARSGGVVAGMLAHAIHNLIVILWT